MSSSNCNSNWVPDFSEADIAATAARPGALLTMELELTRACNLVCKYCYAGSGQALAGELDYAELADVVRQAKALGARRIVVLGGGEPLLYPQLRTLIAHIRGLDLTADVFTNGTLLTRDWAEFFYSHRVSVNVKYNSAKPEVQDFLAGRRGTFQAIQRALDSLRQAGYPDPDHRLGIETVICRQNLDELPEIWRWARRQGYLPYMEMLTPQGRCQEHPDLAPPGSEVQKLFFAVQRLDQEEFGHTWIPTPPLMGQACQRHLYSCLVDSQGNVSPCPGVDLKAGNIRECTLQEILVHSALFSDLRRIRERIRGKCRTCDQHQTCYGCRGAAYHLAGDYLASDPLCWRVQEAKILPAQP